MSMTLDEQLERLKKAEKELKERIAKRNKKRKIQCGGCNGYHQIQDLVAIQSHGYIPPSGEIGGDYWVETELRFVCPTTQVTNRLLFTNDNPNGKKGGIDPEAQFRYQYRSLFREVREVHSEQIQGRWVNNYYVDRNRREFGLVEKR